jgi:hypothetical protein
MLPGDLPQQGDGTGATSIYGTRYADENFIARHTGPGLLSSVSCCRHPTPRVPVHRLHVDTLMLMVTAMPMHWEMSAM